MNTFTKVVLILWLGWVAGLFLVTPYGHPVPDWYQAIPIAVLLAIVVAIALGRRSRVRP